MSAEESITALLDDPKLAARIPDVLSRPGGYEGLDRLTWEVIRRFESDGIVVVGRGMARCLPEALTSFWLDARVDVRASAEASPLRRSRPETRLAATKSRLLLLVIEDRQTVGLTGAESGDGSHFAALCKDILFSHKTKEKAGGSYGPGKSVLWTFSGYATVLFSSNLSEPAPQGDSPRFIGRVELPYHEIGGEHFSGPGWLSEHRPMIEAAVEVLGDAPPRVVDPTMKRLQARLSIAMLERLDKPALVELLRRFSAGPSAGR